MNLIDSETHEMLDRAVAYAEKEIGISMSVLTENLLKDKIK